MNDAGARRAGGELPLRPPEPPRDPLEFLSRSWSASATDVSRALAVAPPAPPLAAGAGSIAEDVAGELDGDGGGSGAPAPGSSFSFASAATSQLIMDRIMAQSQEVSPLTSGRLSHSSGPLNGGGSLSDSPPVSPEIDDTKSGEHCTGRRQDSGPVAQGPEGEEEGGDAGAQRAGPRRRLGGGGGRCGGRRGGRDRCGLLWIRQGLPRRAHGHGGGVRGDARGRAVRRGRGGHGRGARAPGRRRRLSGQRQDPRRRRHHHGRRRHSAARRGDAEGEGAEGCVERRGSDPRGEGHSRSRRKGRPSPPQSQAQWPVEAAASQGAGQQQQQLQRRARADRGEQLPGHLHPGAARPRHRAPQAHPQRSVALEGCLRVHQPDGRGDAEDEEPARWRHHHQEEEERGGGRVQGRGGVAGPAPAGGGRAPALLRPPDGGAAGDRVRVHQPEGVRDVDQGRGAPPQHRRRPEPARLSSDAVPRPAPVAADQAA